jgi:DNA-directed RNA polymerase I subunit RPA1
VQSPGYTFRIEGHTKIIEYDLSAKQKKQLMRRRPDVLLQEKINGLPNKKGPEMEDEDVDMMSPSEEEDEGAGDDLENTDDDDNEEARGKEKDASSLPRAANGRVKTKRGKNERVMAPEECRAHLRRLFRSEATMCSLIFGKHGPFATVRSDSTSPVSADMFFMDVLAVAPTRFRPAKKLGETLFEHSQNELLSKVINTSYRLRDLNIDLRAAQEKTSELDEAAKKRIMSTLLSALIQLQIDVNSFMDTNKNPAPVRQGQMLPPGVKQGLEKKEGLFRKNMMVSFSHHPFF